MSTYLKQNIRQPAELICFSFAVKLLTEPEEVWYSNPRSITLESTKPPHIKKLLPKYALLKNIG